MNLPDGPRAGSAWSRASEQRRAGEHTRDTCISTDFSPRRRRRGSRSSGVVSFLVLLTQPSVVRARARVRLSLRQSHTNVVFFPARDLADMETASSDRLGNHQHMRHTHASPVLDHAFLASRAASIIRCFPGRQISDKHGLFPKRQCLVPPIVFR